MVSSVLSLVREARRGWQWFCNNSAMIGLAGALQMAVIQLRVMRGQSGMWRIRVRGWKRPIMGRYGSSDLPTFKQIFIEREHAPVVALLRHERRDGMLILDCGANVGYASIFFLMHFPGAMVMAIEPDDENFQMLETNLSGLGGRVELVHAGLWSHEVLLGCGNLGFRDGKHWGRQVFEADVRNANARPAVTVAGLLDRSGCDRVTLLKMDIEGAEAVVFSVDCTEWLQRTDCIAIELHDDSAFGVGTDAFNRAVAGHGFELRTSGELTIAIRGAPNRINHAGCRSNARADVS